MVRKISPSILLAATLVVSTTTGHAAPAEPPSGTEKRPSIVETTFKSVDATIAAQWDFPDRSPAPLVVFIPAGGRIDRNGWNPGIGESPDRGMYAGFARELVRAGFAIFRFDKPGAGKSGRGRYATERSNALEAYTRAVDHARIDPDRVFLVGHAGGTDTIAAIYARYHDILPPAGVVFLNNAVGEHDSLRVSAPLLIINSGKYPDDRLQYGSFIVEAREKHAESKLSTELVLLDDVEPGLLSPVEAGGETAYTMDPAAVRATISWLAGQLDSSRKARLH
jgi:alpha-beta hydrolase superfamily lysophospholipase